MSVTFSAEPDQHQAAVSPCEPQLNVTNVNAALILRALGLLSEIGAAAILGPQPGLTPDGCPDLFGECDAADFLARIDLALALHPTDPGVPWHAITDAGNVIDCGRRPGYLHERLHELRDVATFAHADQRRVVWS